MHYYEILICIDAYIYTKDVRNSIAAKENGTGEYSVEGLEFIRFSIHKRFPVVCVFFCMEKNKEKKIVKEKESRFTCKLIPTYL